MPSCKLNIFTIRIVLLKKISAEESAFFRYPFHCTAGFFCVGKLIVDPQLKIELSLIKKMQCNDCRHATSLTVLTLNQPCADMMYPLPNNK